MKGSSVTPCTARSGSGSGGNKTFPHPPILPNESSAWCPFGWTPPPRSDGKAELPRWPADVSCTSLPCVLPDDSPYLTGGHTLLFDLSNDMYEEHDVSAQHPDVVARLLEADDTRRIGRTVLVAHRLQRRHRGVGVRPSHGLRARSLPQASHLSPRQSMVPPPPTETLCVPQVKTSD